MNELYKEDDLNRVHSQFTKRLTILFIIAGLFAAVGIWSLIIRVMPLTIGAVIAAGIVLIFGIEMLCRPIHAYEKLIRSALRGRSHTDTLVYDHLEPEISVVDGVACRSLVFLGAPDKHGTREQLYYWDAELPLPDLAAGETREIKYTGKNIIGYGAAMAAP